MTAAIRSYLYWKKFSSAQLPTRTSSLRRPTVIKRIIRLGCLTSRLPRSPGRRSGHTRQPIEGFLELSRQRAPVSCRHCDCRDPDLTNVDIGNPPAGKDSSREKANAGGELSSILKKRKLDQLKYPNDVDYNSEESTRGSSGEGEGVRPRKQQKPHASRKTSPPIRPILDLHSQLPHDGTGHNSADEKTR